MMMMMGISQCKPRQYKISQCTPRQYKMHAYEIHTHTHTQNYYKYINKTHTKKPCQNTPLSTPHTPALHSTCQRTCHLLYLPHLIPPLPSRFCKPRRCPKLPRELHQCCRAPLQQVMHHSMHCCENKSMILMLGGAAGGEELCCHGHYLGTQWVQLGEILVGGGGGVYVWCGVGGVYNGCGCVSCA